MYLNDHEPRHIFKWHYLLNRENYSLFKANFEHYVQVHALLQRGRVQKWPLLTLPTYNAVIQHVEVLQHYLDML